jgi:selT/selW/selH-like putative selenoprotein
MKRYYLEVEYFVSQQYPEFRGNISGSTYPPSMLAQWIAFTTNIIWLAGIAFLFAGSAIFKALGIPEPDIYKRAKENPVGAFVVLFMINSFGASQLSTGAFEIDVDGQVVFSKLVSGRFPSAHDLTHALSSMGFNRVES